VRQGHRPGRFPSRVFAINAAWLELALTAADLIAWTQTTLLSGDLAKYEPKTLRYRLLHVAARITRGGNANSSSASPNTGPGAPSWPPRSPASTPCRNHCQPDQPHAKHPPGTRSNRHISKPADPSRPNPKTPASNPGTPRSTIY
jgi:hypothetical protein